MKFEKGSAHSLLIVGLIALIIIVLGVVLWKNFLSNGAIPDTSTWKIYKSEGLPVSFKYPNNWTIQQEIEQGKNAGYVKLFGGSTNSVKGYSLGVFYAKDMAKTIPRQSDCSVNLKETKSCEEYKTQTMSGLIIAPKTGSDYNFSTDIGDDRYTFSVNNGYMDINAFKKLLTSVSLK